MSHWNYRVVRREYPDAGLEDGVMYAIHEVHYGEAGETDQKAMTIDPADVIGESIEDLRWTLEVMLLALDKPVLDYNP